MNELTLLPVPPPVAREESAPPPQPGPGSRLLNRELSWLAFNSRVLEEAEDERHPLIERVKFLSIFASNLDEFFMVRVSGLKNQLESVQQSLSDDGLTPAAQLAAIAEMLAPMLARVERAWLDALVPQLTAQGIRIRPLEELPAEARARLDALFERDIFPVLTPLAVDPGHPFPYISGLSLNLAVRLAATEADGQAGRHARVKIPSSLPRLVAIPDDPGGFVDLCDLISSRLDRLFPGTRILACHRFRVTRDADLEIDEDEAEDLLKTVERELKQRRFGAAVRLEIEAAMPDETAEFLLDNLELAPGDKYRTSSFLPCSDLMELTRLDRPDLKDPPLLPAELPAAGADIFAAIRAGDILLHHPFDSFNPVADLVSAAASDREVLAIKMTLYRIGPRSAILPSLMAAAERGKQVAVVIELQARFDEANNIEWAKKLERSGVHVVYGELGLKTHAKLALVVRREGETLRRYVHLSTGNYNPVTARVYTDFGLMTCREPVTDDASALFNALTGAGRNPPYQRLVTAPKGLRAWAMENIAAEAAAASKGRPAGIIAKMNSLVDPAVIQALYNASNAGVPVRLLVRGICCLRPGLAGLSENIEVRSIVGRFLEHSRVYSFLNGGCWLSSADWMPRNFDNRVELCFPIEDPALKRRATDILEIYWRDCVKARRLDADGRYEFIRPGAEQAGFEAQLALMPAVVKPV